jgi:hypothetical protein
MIEQRVRSFGFVGGGRRRAWVVVTSGYLVREHLPTIAVAPPAMGHA